MTITRRIAFAVTGLVVLTVLAGAIGLGAQLWIKTWSSDYNDSAARVREASRISAGSASMVTYGLAEVSTTYELNRTQFEALWQENSAQVTEALASLTALENGRAEKASQVAETINRLGDQTQAVGDIISTVNDIAEQSKQAVSQVRSILSEIQKASASKATA